jgi:hypothetical protein
MKLKRIFSIFGLLTILGGMILLVSCSIGFPNDFLSQPDESVSYPFSEIIFISEQGLGFINSNGTDLVLMPLHRSSGTSFFGRPMITGDGMQLILLGSQATYPVQTGSIYTARPGQPILHCKQWGRGFVWLSEDQQYVFTDSMEGIVKYAINDCGRDTSPADVYDGVFGVLSPDETHAVNVRWEKEKKAKLGLVNIQTSEEIIVGEGNFPSWSRDSQSLAYTGADGIYVYHVASGKSEKISEHFHPSGKEYPLYYERSPWYYPPVVSWSPDGKWLVYHIHGNTHPKQATISILVYDICKINLLTGDETKLFGGGFSPYWRWPAAEE